MVFMSNFCNFVYDLRGNLRFIQSPMYQDDPDMEKYAYEYRYDGRHRCTWKRLPGLSLWNTCMTVVTASPSCRTVRYAKLASAASSSTTTVTASSYRVSARTRRQTVCPPLSTIQAMAVYATRGIHIPPLQVM